ncbi:hypothetical protein [Ancylobacter oerskovii]|uniref:Uncharacterized protein n=1 Tax=Ancylobacter oerskovii TaxID=459519 RepID=A0ABW4Z3F2_9HYPH|nr:hypothetical protein [Ancylobacter oerskovii]MBS7546007.1 hypothetical protein [Ancylobacter oerskovii]
MTRRIAISFPPLATARLLACAALGLALSACGANLPKTSVPDQKLPYPNFGTPAQIGTRPVMDAQAQSQTQSSLENMARNRASEMEQQINQGNDMNVGQ